MKRWPPGLILVGIIAGHPGLIASLDGVSFPAATLLALAIGSTNLQGQSHAL
ncbi:MULTISPECIES: hypothetical protein [unclassified Leptolyngbya]|uniref:hypothetical protein n=1 Tax=unclassified Leptolyngbya TaxID=2650499 RepID=UPI001684BEBF|nr:MULTISPECIES: hypothetical protein [unclassified Leptolyngbya]MBD1910031.1 hypothetical protein [Leptolyngbya sp. FACHB-8]MBD2157161.1 hypothetical protein [Leptolyngbya sp. FACHB-16]